ncbi:hypothetical protein ABEB36_015447 [Hypothenemus hampei]|uniref:Uncharacterized protein n=1 Tax=Hypothenemus hampei TaxID=57062 RepID=A0ABD1E0A3_HYPHA
MALQNLSFFDASQLFPRVMVDRPAEPNISPTDFPNLQQKTTNSPGKNNCVLPSQRRSYAQITSQPTKKRLVQKGYDVQAHNECLHYPYSRPSEEDNNEPEIEFNNSTSCATKNITPSTSTSAIPNEDYETDLDLLLKITYFPRKDQN